jgi:hypothetical protein
MGIFTELQNSQDEPVFVNPANPVNSVADSMRKEKLFYFYEIVLFFPVFS